MYERTAPPKWSLQPLWRYLPQHRLEDLLTTEELFFCHLPRQSDGLEGALSQRTKEHLFQFLLRAHGGDARLAREGVIADDVHREAFYVNCWHMNTAESYLMWKAYASDTGYAIQTTIERLEASFEPFAGVVRGGAVEYIDFSREAFEFGNVFFPVMKKDLPYKDEREFRLVFWRPDLKNAGVVPGPNGIRVKVDLGMLIENIYVSPLVKAVPDALAKLMQSKGLRLIQSGIRVNPVT